MKKPLLLLGILLLAVAAWYLISPIWRVEVRDDASPLASRGTIEALTESDRMEFEKEMEGMGDKVMKKQEANPSDAHIISTATFTASAHDVAGQAILIEQEGEHTLRFENFDTINGPNLHIYLAKDLEARDYFDLGEIRATKGNVNYAIPYEIDFEKYRHVLVWCEPFRVLFSYASFE